MDKKKQARQFRRLAKQMRGHAKRIEGRRGEHARGTAQTFEEIAEGFERMESNNGRKRKAGGA